jgi:xanthine dehydrogenase accessory factor
MDVFVEPMLPRPLVLLFGGSPVAVAIADLARRVGFAIAVAAPAEEQAAFDEADVRCAGYAAPPAAAAECFVVVATQGRGDLDALRAALAVESEYVAFVGSRQKAATLRGYLVEEGVDQARFEKLRSPAGLDLGAITPEEIALSIIAEIVETRRRGQRAPARAPGSEPGAPPEAAA